MSDNALYVAKGEVQPRIKRDARYNNESDEMWHKSLNAQLKWRHTFGEKLRLSNQLSYNDDLIDYFSTEELSCRSKEVDKSTLPTDAPYPAYALLDMGASLDIARGLRFGVDVYNVTNHKTYISALGGNQLFPNAPTTFKAHLSYTL